MNGRGIGDLNRDIIIDKKKVTRNEWNLDFFYLYFTLVPVG